MNKQEVKNLLKETAKLMFPFIPKDRWTMIIHEFDDGDWLVKYVHSNIILHQSNMLPRVIEIMFKHNKVKFLLMDQLYRAHVSELLFEVKI